MNLNKIFLNFFLLNFLFSQILFAQNGLSFKGDNFRFGQITSANGFFDGTFGYLIGGQGDLLKNEIWRYNLTSNEWQFLDTIPFPSRHSPICEKIDNKVYYGLGIKNGVKGEHDFYEYDLDSNVWHKLADFPGTRRANASTLVINNKLYVGLGNPLGVPLKSFWEYNPLNNQWSEKADFLGNERFGAFAFTLNGKGYIGGGLKTASYLSDFWEYNAVNDTWTQKANLPAPVFGAIALVINDKPYVLGGQDVFRYNVQSDTWEQFALSKDFSSRIHGFGYSANNKAYFGTGSDDNKKFSDWWEFDPSLLGVGINKNNLQHQSIKLYPNPSKGTFYLDLNGFNEPNLIVSIYNSQGELVWENQVSPNSTPDNFVCNTDITQSGVYIVKLGTGQFASVQKLIIE